MHELVEIADQRGAMECIGHGRMELNQTYVNDKENNISDLDVGKFTGALTVGMMTNAGNPLGNTASGSDQEHTRWSIHAATRAYMLEHTRGNWSIHAGAYTQQLEHTCWSIHAATGAYMLEHTCGNWRQ